MTIRPIRVAALVALLAPALHAQSGDWRSEYMAVMQSSADKYIQLAEAIPQDRYSWRPGEGVRSVAEVLLHVASANYGMPGRLGAQPPAGVDLRGLERSTTDKAAIVQHLRAAFAHFRAAVEVFPADQPEKMVPFFGPPQITARHFLYFNADHNGEHLGQLIAYARMNGVVPPWSAGGN